MSRERPGHTLQTTALVNEAYLRLVSRKVFTGRTAHTSSPSQHSSCAPSWLITREATLMRSVEEGTPGLHSRKRVIVSQERASEVVALDEALKQLEEIDRRSRIVELSSSAG